MYRINIFRLILFSCPLTLAIKKQLQRFQYYRNTYSILFF